MKKDENKKVGHLVVSVNEKEPDASRHYNTTT